MRVKLGRLLPGLTLVAASWSARWQATALFRDPTQSLATRVNNLIAQLSLEEKAQQMLDQSPAIARLGIPAYSWWNEALPGVGRPAPATVFPQAIGLGATLGEALALCESAWVGGLAALGPQPGAGRSQAGFGNSDN